MKRKELEDFISQPLDGLLYDLGLLPEQCEPGGRGDLIRQVIVALYDRCHPVKSSVTVTGATGIEMAEVKSWSSDKGATG